MAPQGGTVRCGFLTAPEDAASRTVAEAVLRWTPQGDLLPDPILDIDYSFCRSAKGRRLRLAPRETFILDERGTDDRTRPRLLGARRDRVHIPIRTERRPEWRGSFETPEALSRQARRPGDRPRCVRSAGDGGGRGGPAWRSGRRVEPPRSGSGARLALEMIRRYPEHIRATWLDTPERLRWTGSPGRYSAQGMRCVGSARVRRGHSARARSPTFDTILRAPVSLRSPPRQARRQGRWRQVPILWTAACPPRVPRGPHVLAGTRSAAAVASPSALVEYGSTGRSTTPRRSHTARPGRRAHHVAHGASCRARRDQLASRRGALVAPPTATLRRRRARTPRGPTGRGGTEGTSVTRPRAPSGAGRTPRGMRGREATSGCEEEGHNVWRGR